MAGSPRAGSPRAGTLILGRGRARLGSAGPDRHSGSPLKGMRGSSGAVTGHSVDIGCLTAFPPSLSVTAVISAFAALGLQYRHSSRDITGRGQIFVGE